MNAIAVVAPSGAELDRITVNGDGFDYGTGAARGLVEGLLETGMPPAAVADALADWSNGYLITRKLPDGVPPPPPIPGFVALIGQDSITAAFNPGQRRDSDGRWSDGAPGDAPDVDLDDEEDDDGADEGDEHRNVERFPSRYLRKYGHVVEEYPVGEDDLFVAKTDKGNFHVARGENNRQVLIELDDRKAESLADFVLLFSENQPNFHVTDPISGATLRSLGDGGVRVEWPDGPASDLTEDGALFLQEGLRSLGPGFRDDDD